MVHDATGKMTNGLLLKSLQEASATADTRTRQLADGSEGTVYSSLPSFGVLFRMLFQVLPPSVE